jgi:hypothetical protein
MEISSDVEVHNSSCYISIWTVETTSVYTSTHQM